MKKYLLISISIVITPLVLCSLSFRTKSGKNPFPELPEKAAARPTSPKMYSEEILRNDLEEIKNILITNHPAPYQFTGTWANISLLLRRWLNRYTVATRGSVFQMNSGIIKKLYFSPWV
jgi:hypothetical protein